MTTLRRIGDEDLRAWLAERGGLDDLGRSIGRRLPEAEFQELAFGVPVHLRFLVEKLGAAAPLDAAALDSIPFYSLCKGLFLPLAGLAPERVTALFGIAGPAPLDAAGREALLGAFFARRLGLSPVQKIACVLGDPFLGKAGTLRRDSLLRLLQSLELTTSRALLDRLPGAGDVAVLFAENRPALRAAGPPLTAAEVLETLRLLPDEKRTRKFDLLRSLLLRMGKLEAFFLAKLVLRKAGFGFDYQGPLVARVLAEAFAAPVEQVAHAMALTDAFHVARLLVEEGPAALRRVQIQPLVPLRPALAGGTTDEIDRFPVWVERKYDGVRLMLHKSTDAGGTVLCGAYTRTRGSWLEQVAGLDATIRCLPARAAIVDGELYGTILDIEGSRPASVYEVFAALQGEAARPVQLRYAAFDIVFLEGRDLTGLPLSARRQQLAALLAPLAALQLPVPLTLADGQLAASPEEVGRLYGHFRAQGYEGIVAKDPQGAYLLGDRDPRWRKRKPEITLDLVLVGAVLAVTTKAHAGTFGSYVFAARNPEGGFDEVGDIAGLDRERDAQVHGDILREGLLTGRRIERASSSGVRPGFELRPHIVVTVRFEGIVREPATNRLTLRDPKVVSLRADKPAAEADTVAAIEEIYLRQRIG